MTTLNAGIVQIYNVERGFGFISSVPLKLVRSKSVVFFHISKVKEKCPELAILLEQGECQKVCFWYEVEATSKGLCVSNLWRHQDDIPFGYADKIADFNARVESYWRNTGSMVPDWINTTTLTVLGQARKDYLHELREKLIRDEKIQETEAQRCREKKEIELAEQQRIAAQQLHIANVAKWRQNPRGMRNDGKVRYICIKCGSKASQLGRPQTNPICQSCNETWYVNHCWSCKDGRIDSRDPDTPKCVICDWYKCAVCKSCHQYGCSSNPYSLAFRHRNDPSPIKPDYYERENQDQLRASAAEYGFNLDTDDISYDEDMDAFFDGDHFYPA